MNQRLLSRLASLAAAVFPAASALLLLACTSSTASSTGSGSGACTPPAGTYAIVYTNTSDSDSGVCAAPPNSTVTLPYDAGTVATVDAGIACISNGCTDTCAGTLDGIAINSTTTVSISASGYSGTDSETTSYGDGGVVSTCSFSFTATRQ
jgi:hypothetical protein